MRSGRPCRGRDGMDVAVRLQQPERTAAEQKHNGNDGQPDHGRAPARRNNETPRRSSPARPEAVARRRIGRSPPEVGLMMGESDRCVKEFRRGPSARYGALAPTLPSPAQSGGGLKSSRFRRWLGGGGGGGHHPPP